MERYDQDDLTRTLHKLAKEIHANAKDKGFYDPPPSDCERIVLMHSELSEAVEWLRHGNPKSDHIELSGLEEELADVIIRILDYAEYKNLRIARAIFEKHEFNKTRPHKHGGKTI